VLACAAAACGGAAEESAADGEALADVVSGAYVHKMPVRSEEERAAFLVRSQGIINTSGAHLLYYGGKVVQNASVVQVLYGGSGTYLSGVLNNMGAFYGSVLASTYVDWLKEYNTTSPAQSIGRGTFHGKVAITPAAARNKTTITDANIQAEISAQITAGHLPTPTNNIIYMVNFPKGKHISQGGTRSCQGGGFCAYHGTFKKGSQNVYYGVLPDMSAGSGCDTGCGSSANPFNNQTAVASHELIETITDAEVGLATVVGPPLAWYDSANGEIGDICNGQQGVINGYTVQKEWSNKSNACKVQ
jgi:hypothetical protein